MKTQVKRKRPAGKITIEVDERTASAYEQARPEVQQEAQACAADILRLSLLSKEELADEFDRLTARTGATARAKGWTDEMNEALLRGEYDE